MVVFLALGVLLSSVPAASAAKKKSSVDDGALVKAGVIITSNDDFSEFQLDGSKWARLPYDTRKGTVIVCSEFNKEHHGNGVVVLRDYMSGAKLGSYDSWHGVRIAGADD